MSIENPYVKFDLHKGARCRNWAKIGNYSIKQHFGWT